jgi:trimeric autotransporter adhesin
VHEQVAAGVQYYRLKQVDFDGGYTYSPIEAVTLSGGTIWNVWPNPAHDVLHLPDLEGRAELIDITGRSIAAVQLPQAAWDIRAIPAGSYLLRIVNGNTVITRQQVIQ